jgi:uncharacterized protein YycO
VLQNLLETKAYKYTNLLHGMEVTTLAYTSNISSTNRAGKNILREN